MQDSTVLEIKAGDKIEKALLSISKAREELTECLINEVAKLEPEAPACKDPIEVL